jgi:signal transduction histidine kinase
LLLLQTFMGVLAVTTLILAGVLAERKRTEGERARLMVAIEHEQATVADVTTARALALLDERERIAMDIHDGVIQSLYAVALRLSAHERLLDAKAEETRQALQLARQISNITQELRDVIFGLRQHRRQPHDLQTGIKILAMDLFSHTSIYVDLELEDRTDRFLDAVRTDNILYIAHEAMSNVLRHASASKVMIRLARIEEKLVLTIRDNGRGFALLPLTQGTAARQRDKVCVIWLSGRSCLAADCWS